MSDLLACGVLGSGAALLALSQQYSDQPGARRIQRGARHFRAVTRATCPILAQMRVEEAAVRPPVALTRSGATE
jgi:hypothetical protein